MIGTLHNSCFFNRFYHSLKTQTLYLNSIQGTKNGTCDLPPWLVVFNAGRMEIKCECLCHVDCYIQLSSTGQRKVVLWIEDSDWIFTILQNRLLDIENSLLLWPTIYSPKYIISLNMVVAIWTELVLRTLFVDHKNGYISLTLFYIFVCFLNLLMSHRHWREVEQLGKILCTHYWIGMNRNDEILFTL